MSDYSGRTTAYEHKFEDWEDKFEGEDCIKQETIFDVQWSNCPVEVEDEVRELWRDYELGNDHYYFKWNGDLRDDYPLIHKYLTQRGVTNCLIHWWW